MGLLGELLGGFAGQNPAQGTAQQPGQSLFSSGGGMSSALVPVLMTLLASQSAGGQSGGVLGSLAGGLGGSGNSPLSGLLGRFEQAGLGQVAQSWVGSGPNQPITPQQLHGVLGDEQIQNLASQSGMQPQTLLSELAHVLPGLVDKLTPRGELPSPADMEAPQALQA